MKLFADFLPIVAFFVAYKLYDIYVATLSAIILCTLFAAITFIKTKKLEKMQLITLGLILTLGGATLFFHDETFIKWKPTAVNWLFACVFLGSHFIGHKTVIERMMSHAVELPALIWRRLNVAWAVFFILMGAANIVVISLFDTDTWVNFKLFGNLGLTLAFVLLQSLYLAKHIKE